MRDEPWTPERQKRLFDELDRDKALEQIIKERRAKRDAQEEARLRGPDLEDVADDDYLRSVIRDPDAGHWDDAARENNRRYTERFDVHADDHLPRGALIAEAVEVDRVAARPTEHIKSKKRGTARKASPKKPIREAAKVLRYAALNASLLHHPMAYRKGAQVGTESVFIGDHPYPSPFAVQVMVLLTHYAQKHGNKTKEGYEVEFPTLSALISAMNKHPTDKRNRDNAYAALDYWTRTGVQFRSAIRRSLREPVPHLNPQTGERKIDRRAKPATHREESVEQVIKSYRFENDTTKTGKLTLMVRGRWLSINKLTSRVSVDLDALFSLSEPNHINALAWLSARRSQIQGKPLNRRLDVVERELGLTTGTAHQRKKLLRAAVDKVAAATGIGYKVDIDRREQVATFRVEP